MILKMFGSHIPEYKNNELRFPSIKRNTTLYYLNINSFPNIIEIK